MRSDTSSPTSAARPRWPNTKPATVWKSSVVELGAELLVEVVDRERAVDPDRRLVEPLDRLVGEVELVLDVADDLLEHVLERDDPRRRAVLVDDDRHVLVRLPELREQGAEVLRLGHDVRRTEQRLELDRRRACWSFERGDERPDVEDPERCRRATRDRPGSGCTATRGRAGAPPRGRARSGARRRRAAAPSRPPPPSRRSRRPCRASPPRRSRSRRRPPRRRPSGGCPRA